MAHSEQHNFHARSVRSGTLSTRARLWIIILVIAVIAVLFLFSGNGLYHSARLSRMVAALEDRIDSLESVNAQMAERIDGLQKGDLKVIEEEARSHGMIKQGEKVYMLRSKPE